MAMFAEKLLCLTIELVHDSIANKIFLRTHFEFESLYKCIILINLTISSESTSKITLFQ